MTTSAWANNLQTLVMRRTFVCPINNRRLILANILLMYVNDVFHSGR